MAEVEQVLVVERQVLETLGLFQGATFQVAPYLHEIWRGSGVKFMPRPEAENNPAFKQLIPYVVMTHSDRFLCYTRGTDVDETRLASRVSIGVGGHINPCDARGYGGLQETYRNAVAREVEEEVVVDTAYGERIIAAINDDSNEVGRVHFGIVHLWHLAKPNVRERERSVCRLTFMREHELRGLEGQMESWSRLLLANLGSIGKMVNV